MILGVRAVARSTTGEFLLVRHTYTPGWHFPGSGIEISQAAEKALADELPQETGLFVSGAAQDLPRQGFDTAAIMQADGWKSVNTLSRYLEKAGHHVWA